MAEGSGSFTTDGPEEPASRVPDEDAVYRRVPHSKPDYLYLDPLTGDRCLTDGAFRFKPGEDGVSVYREQLLFAAGLGAADVVTKPANLVVRLGVMDVRSVRPLDVRNDPWPSGVPDPEHPRHGAHGLIIGWSGLDKSQRRACQHALVVAPSLQFVYP